MVPSTQQKIQDGQGVLFPPVVTSKQPSHPADAASGLTDYASQPHGLTTAVALFVVALVLFLISKVPLAESIVVDKVPHDDTLSLSQQEIDRRLDGAARRDLNMSGDEFKALWTSGAFQGTELEHDAAHLAIYLPTGKG